MYSPKIREELIPRLYRLAKKRQVPMTDAVNALLAEALAGAEGKPTGPEAFQDFHAPFVESRASKKQGRK